LKDRSVLPDRQKGIVGSGKVLKNKGGGLEAGLQDK